MALRGPSRSTLSLFIYTATIRLAFCRFFLSFCGYNNIFYLSLHQPAAAEPAVGVDVEKKKETAAEFNEATEKTAVLFCGTTDWDIASSKEKKDELLAPHRLRGLLGHTVSSVSASQSGTHFGVITSDGQLFMFGRNDQGQLGLGDTKNRKALRQVLATICSVFTKLCVHNKITPLPCSLP